MNVKPLGNLKLKAAMEYGAYGYEYRVGQQVGFTENAMTWYRTRMNTVLPPNSNYRLFFGFGSRNPTLWRAIEPNLDLPR